MKKQNIIIGMLITIVVVGFVGYLVNIYNYENRLASQYNEQVKELQNIKTSYQFDNNKFFIYGNDEMLKEELKDLKPYKEVGNNKYYIVVNTSDNNNKIVLAIINGKLKTYGKYEAKILNIEEKEENINNLEKIL